MARICFLFNHDQIHQIAHSLPIAMELARNRDHSVVLAVGDIKLAERIDELLGADTRDLEIVNLDLNSRLSRTATRLLESVVPARKILLYRDNLEFFRSFDALVVTEKTSLLLKSRYGLENLKIIHTRHGAGDRAIGFGKESAEFDLVLVAGPKIGDRLIRDAGVHRDNIRITGYPKFDLFAGQQMDNPFPDPTRPTVLYTPHPSPSLSSYYKMGQAVLDAFASSDKYNLVFAPHIMLFERNWTVTISPPAIRRVPAIGFPVERCPHILIDRGSTASTDMSYTNLADLYIGDASSQIYEYLVRPRPVLHLDAHQTDWQNKEAYRHWCAGPVATHNDNIIAAADNAFASHPDYLAIQQEMLAETFSVTDEPSSVRAAMAISDYLNQQSQVKP